MKNYWMDNYFCLIFHLKDDVNLLTKFNKCHKKGMKVVKKYNGN